MAEPATLYIPRQDPISEDELRQFAGDNPIEIVGEGDKWTSATVRFKDATLKLNFEPERDINDFVSHIMGFQGYVWNCAGKKMTAPVYALIQRLYLMHSNVGTSAEPKITPDVESYLSSLAGNAHGLIFHGSAVCGPDFKKLITPEGYVEGAKMTYWPDSLERRAKSIATLAKAGIQVPETKPIASEREVQMQDAGKIAIRACIVYILAYYGVPQGIDQASAKTQLKPFAQWLTDEEKAFLEAEQPTDQQKINFAWRFEALWMLLWALKLVEDPGPLSTPQKVPDIDKVIKQNGGIQGLVNRRELRTNAEILDQADYVMRAHWATRQARIKKQAPPAGLNNSVIQERHHALNWMISFEWNNWDEIDTPT